MYYEVKMIRRNTNGLKPSTHGTWTVKASSLSRVIDWVREQYPFVEGEQWSESPCRCHGWVSKGRGILSYSISSTEVLELKP